ncbi:MAG: hypothetical protein FWE29_02995 [Defluviitaleaceae bacterium]|nr:hypothetical protein [Defluviitaleaceae bacterium]
MQSKLQELFKKKDKKTVVNLLAILVAGLILLTFSGSLFGGTTDDTSSDIILQENIEPVMAMNVMPSQDRNISHEADLERRLEEILSLVSGAGEVRVMVTIRQERELIIASDTIHNTFITKESDSDGGIREISDINIEERNILIQDNGGLRPLILTENSPQIEGIIIIAQGGDNILVRDALIRASQAVLGININRIQVLKMK